MRSLVTIAAAMTFWAGSARSAEPVQPPLFEMRIADGTTRVGALLSIDDKWSVRLGGKNAAQAKGAEIVSLRRAGTGLPPYPHAEQVILADGGRLLGRHVSLADDVLHFRAHLEGNHSGEITLPISAVAIIWLAAPKDAIGADLWIRKLTHEERASDTIWLRNGDRLDGTLVSMSNQGFRIKREREKEIVLPRSKVAAVALNSSLMSGAKPKGIYGNVVLANGTRLILKSARLVEGVSALRAELPMAAGVEIPIEQIVALEIRNGCAVCLSDLKPSDYEYTPFFEPSWPYSVDEAISGRDLRLAGNTYDKGVSMHARSRLSFQLAGSYRAFEALVGLDDVEGKGGRARIQVLLDGKPADLGGGALSRELSFSKGPQRLRVDVTQKQKLTLVVDWGPRGHVRACVDWVEACLIRPIPKR